MSEQELRDLTNAVAVQVMGQSLGNIQRGGTLPLYAEDIAAAWLVVERMTEQGYCFTLKCQGRHDWWAEFYTVPSSIIGAQWANGPTAPEAICRAALQAPQIEHP